MYYITEDDIKTFVKFLKSRPIPKSKQVNISASRTSTLYDTTPGSSSTSIKLKSESFNPFYVPNNLLVLFLQDVDNDIEVVRQVAIIFSMIAKINLCNFVSEIQKKDIRDSIMGALSEKTRKFRLESLSETYQHIIDVYDKYFYECQFDNIDFDKLFDTPAAEGMLNSSSDLMLLSSNITPEYLNHYFFSPLKIAYLLIQAGVCYLSDNFIIDIIQSVLSLLEFSGPYLIVATFINKFIKVYCSNVPLLKKTAKVINIITDVKKCVAKQTNQSSQLVATPVARSQNKSQSRMGSKSTIGINRVYKELTDNLIDLGFSRKDASVATNVALGGAMSVINYKNLTQLLKYKKYETTMELHSKLPPNDIRRTILSTIGFSTKGRPPKTPVHTELITAPTVKRAVATSLVLLQLNRDSIQNFISDFS